MSRRTFLQAAGFTMASAATAGCSRPPAQSRLTHLNQPDAVPAGVRLQYATTCAGCSAGCGVLASVRDARPLKLEGLPGHPISQGRLCAAGQASILGLYDSQRVRQPVLNGRAVSWMDLDGHLGKAIAATRGAIRILTSTDAASSPTTRAVIARFLGRFDDARHDVYDVMSSSAIAEAHEATHGRRALPRFRFDRAAAVVAIDADFLGTWISPVEFAGAYARARPRWHLQIESCMTLTGAKADERVVIAPDEVGHVLNALAERLAQRDGRPFDASSGLPPGLSSQTLDQWVDMLWQARGHALVVCGSADAHMQRLVNFINDRLGAYGSTLDLAAPSMQRRGNDGSLQRLRVELAGGQVDVLITCGVNPVHSLPDGERWRDWLAKVPVFAAVTERMDETAALARYVCPAPHYLETWGDYEPIAGTVCLRQPTTEATGNTRSFDASLSAWSGAPLDAQSIVKRHWCDHVFQSERDGASFESFWDRSLRDGWVQRPVQRVDAPSFDSTTVRLAPATRDHAGGLMLVGYPSVALQDGRQAFNPWLLELPDPVTQVTWDSCASVGPATADALGVRDGDLVTITVDDATLEVPVVVQPGQHERVVAVPIGFGQVVTRRFANLGPRWLGGGPRGDDAALVGVNVAPLLGRLRNGGVLAPSKVRVTATGRRREPARPQEHADLDSIGTEAWGTEASGALIRRSAAAGNLAAERTGRNSTPQSVPDLWQDENVRPEGVRWGMTIDLDACTGCNACVVACQVENNTPVVGRDEVRRHRNMHWLRVDRYYLSGTQGPVMTHQPMTCHHCGHAPCETVCPVLATTHSSDGLNQQTYSRCIGTRYCMNNCPFKVRRFNWFDYAHDAPIENLVLNPDVTVRSRGVAEKCTFCVQRIQEARLTARMQGREPADGDVVTACEQTCPARAITFGDLNDPHSRVHSRAREGRAYTLLDGLNLDPSVRYLALVRRPRPATEDDGGV